MELYTLYKWNEISELVLQNISLFTQKFFCFFFVYRAKEMSAHCLCIVYIPFGTVHTAHYTLFLLLDTETKQ